MTWEPRPVPNVTPETEAFWRAASKGELVIPYCAECDLSFYYPRARCPECLNGDIERRRSDGTGRVYSYTVVRQSSGWPEDDLPLIIAYVELDEGPRVTTNLVDCSLNEVAIGVPVEVVFEETEDEHIGIPLFTPIG